jgi:phosphonate transport system ATP-binding protein
VEQTVAQSRRLPVTAGTPLLAIAALSKVYPGGQRALDNVNLVVERPEVIAIIGSSGAGKSTLIRCINRLVEPTAGQIRLGGIDIAGLSRRNLRAMRRRIGMIFQEFNLVERLTVMENVLSGRLGSVGFFASLRRRFAPADVSGAYALLDRVGLAGYQDTRADALSGGQRQRVGISRALMQNPDLLLVDEPTASLDPRTARQIMRLIKELASERHTPALINIHDVALAQTFADRVIGLKNGRVAFDGPPSMLTPETLTEIYGAEDWNQTIRRAENENEAAASS